MADEFVRLLKGELTPKNTPGIAYREDNRVVVNTNKPQVNNLDLLPFPARDLLDNAAYFSLLSKWRNFTLMLGSRGCPWSCRFCEHRMTLYRKRSAANVEAEMEEANKRFGILEFDFVEVVCIEYPPWQLSR